MGVPKRPHYGSTGNLKWAAVPNTSFDTYLASFRYRTIWES